MSLTKQIHLYSLGTDAFYNPQEKTIHERLLKLYKLKQKGVFNNLAGIWLGNYEGDYPIEKILIDTIDDLNLDIPVIKSNNFGHTEKKMTIPIGIEAEMTENNIQIIEDYLED